jgi:hemolysin activation/secretion protein
MLSGLILALLFLLLPPAVADQPLPPVPSQGENLLQQAQVKVAGFRFEGNQIFTSEELAEQAAPWLGRQISMRELVELKDHLTRFYIDQGYVNSGALIPDQQVKEGIVLVRIVEGRLTDIRIKGYQGLRLGYLQPRVEGDDGDVLNILNMRQRLKLLEENPLIERVNARLLPGLHPGEAELELEVSEASPYHLKTIVDNHRPPSVGSMRGRVELGHRNLTGWGDALIAHYDITDGTGNYGAAYTLPLGGRGATLSLSHDSSDSLVVEPPFDVLDFESESRVSRIAFRYPWRRTPAQEIAFGVKLTHADSKTYLGGFPFAFPPSLEESRSTVLSLSQEWVERSRERVFAAYSSFDFGLNWLDAADRRGEIGIDGQAVAVSQRPDGLFLAWTGQLQWMEKLALWESEILARLDLRWANDTLMAQNRFSIGGSSSVRGYRENSLIRDGGLVAGLEWRIPLVRLPLPGISTTEVDGLLHLVPFVDYGYGWNANGEAPEPQDIASVGLGLRWNPSPEIRTELFWGHPLRDLPVVGERDLQDDGVHFSLTVEWL